MLSPKRIKINRLPVGKARINLEEVISKSHRTKQYFVLEKDGIPVAGIMDIDEFEDYLETKAEQEDPKFQAQIREGFEAYRAGNVRTADEFFASLKSKKS